MGVSTRVGGDIGEGAAETQKVWAGAELTLQRRETTVQDELEIAQLPLAEDDGGEPVGLLRELLAARSIAGNQVLEDTTLATKSAGLSIRRAGGSPWGGLAMFREREESESEGARGV